MAGGLSLRIIRRVPAALLMCCAFLLCSASASAYDAAKNDNNDDNGLGLLAKACAESFCWSGVTSLDLWITLEEVCSPITAQPYMGNLLTREATAATSTQTHQGWSLFTTFAVCLSVWTASIYVGYQSGTKVGINTKGGYPVS